VSGLDRLDPPSGRRQTLGFRFVLVLSSCHLHVVHGVSTPYEEAKNSLFVHSENSIAYCEGVGSWDDNNNGKPRGRRATTTLKTKKEEKEEKDAC
jgi:hypothetical protein